MRSLLEGVALERVKTRTLLNTLPYLQELRSITCLMPRYKSGITWFDDDVFIGSEITFPGNASRWKLERKINERESCQKEEDVKKAGLVFEGRVVFAASNVDDSFPGEEAIIKIKMQYDLSQPKCSSIPFSSSFPRIVCFYSKMKE